MSFSSGTFTINTSGQPVVTGTTISSTAFNALTADLATGLSTCVLKDGTQTTTAAVPFVAGINLTSVAGTSYQTGTTATTFTFDGSGGTTGSITLTWQRIANWVTMNVPEIKGTSGTSSATLTANTALTAAVRPTSTVYGFCRGWNNGAEISTPGMLQLGSDGLLIIRRDSSNAAWTNSSSCGTSGITSFTYYLA